MLPEEGISVQGERTLGDLVHRVLVFQLRIVGVWMDVGLFHLRRSEVGLDYPGRGGAGCLMKNIWARISSSSL